MTVTAVVPAFNNARTIGETVTALAGDERVDEILVVDDGSTDSTTDRARSAGAKTIRLDRNRGKHMALLRGMKSASGDTLIMVDGDTGASSSQVANLLEPLRRKEADMVVGVLPSAGRAGGFGIVKKFAKWCIRAASGFESRAPMSGQRALTRELFESCGLKGHGYAVDARLTADAVRRGFRVVEIEIDMTHDHKGRSFHGFAHRARQGWHILRSFVPVLLTKRPKEQHAR